MAISFHFTQNGQTVILPVNPDEIEVQGESDNENTNILGLGEITIIRPAKLKTLTISKYFPRHPDAPEIITKRNFRPASFYLKFFENVKASKKPMKLTVTDTEIVMYVTIEKFDVKRVAQDNDIYYTLELKQWRNYGAKVVTPVTTLNGETTPPKTPPAAEPRPNTSGSLTVGANVLVNGRLHKDSYGAGAGQTKTNYKGKISIIARGRKCPYHITTPTGSWLGWVEEGAVTLL